MRKILIEVGKDTLIESNEVTYIANAGVLLKLGDKKILIDGFCKSVTPIYKSTPADISGKMICGIPPFDNIDLMLITHEHGDHFDGEGIARFLQHNPNTVVISTDEVISSIKDSARGSQDFSLIVSNPELHQSERLWTNGISVQAMAMRHDGKEFANVKNLAYLVQYEKTILHLGDAAPVKENFSSRMLEQENIDLLIANFPYVGLPSGRKIVKEEIKPQKIAIVHLPYPELDTYGWIKATKRSYERVEKEFVPTEFLEEVGDTIKFF